MEGALFRELHAPSSTFQRETKPIKKRKRREQNPLPDEQGNIQNCGEFSGISLTLSSQALFIRSVMDSCQEPRGGVGERMQNGEKCGF
jgi:hypothetical protein